ncbi:uncharacterized protein [Gossypium hirsutum]|uniref:RNase H type-1 domain-containing protein n=1 Tax=Gossypium hirsutum TaxID=3635 RepID=A0ABM3BLM1_GOSHI|nr:uncharacterized protein LOC121228969 [Gossypium hirsutum]
MGLRAAIERKIRVLEVYRDFALVIYHLRGEWETRDSKLINYRGIVLGLIEKFDDITFNYLPRDENQKADTLATLASMINVSKQEDVKPIQMSICEASSYFYNMEEEERDDHPWYQDILRYVRNREYPDQATENDKRTLRRLTFLLIEVEIPSLRVLSELNLDEAEWIQSRYDQLNLVEKKRLRAIQHGQMYQKRMMQAYDKKVHPREFLEGDLVLKKIIPIQNDFRGQWMPN